MERCDSFVKAKLERSEIGCDEDEDMVLRKRKRKAKFLDG